MTVEHYNTLLFVMEKSGPLSPEDKLLVKEQIKLVTIKKNDLLIKQGEKNGPVGIVHSGILRVFSTNVKGDESTLFFRKPEDYVGVFSPIFIQNEKKSWSSVQAITDCDVLIFTPDALSILKTKLSSWEHHERYIFQTRYVEMENRILSSLTSDATMRYELFIKEYNSILNHIPQYLIASYLGMTSVSLSRIRANRNQMK